MPTTAHTPSTQSHPAVFVFDESTSQALLKLVKRQHGVLHTAQIDALIAEHDIDVDTLLRACLSLASQLAVAPVSKFYVGAIVLGVNKEGESQFYFGANIEFASQALSLVVHAEQSAINNAWLNGVQKIIKIAISDAPCGHCRQFMNELTKADELDILLPTTRFKLTELLPHSFGPKDLENQYCLLEEAAHKLTFNDELNCCEQLKSRALQAYAPYSGNYSAAKISTYSDGDFFGCYAENAAYNPSLSPLQSALSQLYLAGLTFDSATVKRIELLETKGKQNQLMVSQAVLASYDNLPALAHICLSLNE